MLETVIQRPCRDGVTGLVLDLSQLAFIDSTGLRVQSHRFKLIDGYNGS